MTFAVFVRRKPQQKQIKTNFLSGEITWHVLVLKFQSLCVCTCILHGNYNYRQRLGVNANNFGVRKQIELEEQCKLNFMFNTLLLTT